MKDYTYPDRIAITPVDRFVITSIQVPGSKSITNRALVLAALADMDGPLTIQGVNRGEDAQVMVKCLRDLGYAITPNWEKEEIRFDFQERQRVPASTADLNAGDSGTSMRFLAALVCAGSGRFRIDGSLRMRQRPMQPLLDALNQFDGVRARAEFANGCAPIIVDSNGLLGGRIKVEAGLSSQFLSALLLIAPFAERDVEIQVAGPMVSEPYVAMTTAIIQEWGVTVEMPQPWCYRVPAGQVGRNPKAYIVEADASAASYWFAAAAIVAGHVNVDGFLPEHCTIQGDIQLLDVLREMGCNVERDLLWNTIDGPRELRGISADMNHISDTAMTLAAVACFADSPTTIRNVAHIRHKECDRISAMTTELRKLGVEVEEHPDGWTITPGPMHGAELETYNDHRIAMSLALIGLKVPGVVIKNPGCVAKTYPGFWEDFQKLYE